MEITKPDPKTIIITKSKRKHLHYLVTYIVFFGIYYFILLREIQIPVGKITIEYIQDNPTIIISFLMLVVPIGIFPQVYKSYKIFMEGEEFILDGNSKIIKRNNDSVALFNEVVRLKIKTIKGEGADEYRLSIILNSGNKIEIHTDTSKDTIDSLADNITDVLDVEIVRK